MSAMRGRYQPTDCESDGGERKGPASTSGHYCFTLSTYTDTLLAQASITATIAHIRVRDAHKGCDIQWLARDENTKQIYWWALLTCVSKQEPKNYPEQPSNHHHHTSNHLAMCWQPSWLWRLHEQAPLTRTAQFGEICYLKCDTKKLFQICCAFFFAGQRNFSFDYYI